MFMNVDGFERPSTNPNSSKPELNLLAARFFTHSRPPAYCEECTIKAPLAPARRSSHASLARWPISSLIYDDPPQHLVEAKGLNSAVIFQIRF